MIASNGNVYLLANGAGNKDIRSNKKPNSFVVLNYNIKENSLSKLNAKRQNGPSTERPLIRDRSCFRTSFLSGFLKGKSGKANISSPKSIAKGAYAGLFNFNFKGSAQKDVTDQFTYWDDRSKTDISRKGYFGIRDPIPIFIYRSGIFRGTPGLQEMSLVKKYV